MARLSYPGRRISAPLAAAIVASLGAADHAAAQSADTFRRLEEVVVTATRTATPISQIGSSISVIDSAELQRQQAIRVFEVMDQVPGVSIANSESVAPRVHIRGAPFEHTLVLIDGVRMTMPSFRRSEIINTITPDNIERVEVLRGPQSTLYGGDAAAGVINLITKRGEGPPSGSVSAEYGSWNTRKVSATARGSSNGFDYSVEGGAFRSDWFSVGDPNGARDERRHETLSARSGYQFNEAWRVEGILRWLETTRGDDNFDIDANRMNEDEDYVARVQLLHAPPGGSWQNLVAVSRSGNRSQGFENGVPRNSKRDQRITQLDYQGNLELGPEQLLTFGAEYNEQQVTGGIFAAVNPDDISNHAAFMQYQGAAGNLFYTVGGRHDENSTFGGFTTYRMTGAYLLNDQLRFKGNLGSGFRTPSMAQLTGTSACPNGNPSLDPERNVAAEIGLERRFEPAGIGDFRVELNFFRNRISDVIVGTSCDGGPPLQNKDRRDARGSELAVQWTPTESLTLNANISYIDATDRVGTDSARAEGIPRRMANLGVRYDVGTRFSVNAQVGYNGDRLDPPATLESFTLVKLAAEYRASERWTLFGRIDNALDEDYQTTRRAQTANRNAHLGARAVF